MIAFPLADVFVPDGDEARRLAEQELSKQRYQAAEPTWFDRWTGDLVRWVIDLFTGERAGDSAPFAVTLIVIVVVSALVVTLLVWGRPRAPHAVRGHPDLLGERDDRSSAQLRADAERSAGRHDWDGAVVLRYRALARGLLERDLIDPAPGATAQGLAREASSSFPGFADRLHRAATLFDAVRYLRAPADEAAYRELAATDDELRTASPLLADTERVPA